MCFQQFWVNWPFVCAVHSVVCLLLLVVLHFSHSGSPIASKQNVVPLNGLQVPFVKCFHSVQCARCCVTEDQITSLNPFHLLFVMRLRQIGCSHHMDSGLDLLSCTVYSLLSCVQRLEVYFGGKLEVTGRTARHRKLQAETSCSVVAHQRHVFFF